MSELRIDIAILKRILMLGIPMGLQQAITSLSNVVVTSYVNAFGSDSMAGWSAYLRIHNLVLMPIMSLSMAITSFVGQNYGARRYDRIRKGTRNILILGCACAIVCGGLIILLQKPSISLFNNDPGVIYYGCIFINMQLPLMWFASLCNLLAGSLRGMGGSHQPTLICLFSFVVCRQVYLACATALSNTIQVVAFSYPVGWLICTLLMALYYRRRAPGLLSKPENTTSS